MRFGALRERERPRLLLDTGALTGETVVVVPGSFGAAAVGAGGRVVPVRSRKRERATARKTVTQKEK